MESISATAHISSIEPAQIWQQRVLPLLPAHLAECGGTTAAYLVLHEGAATVSLLEVDSTSEQSHGQDVRRTCACRQSAPVIPCQDCTDLPTCRAQLYSLP